MFYLISFLLFCIYYYILLKISHRIISRILNEYAQIHSSTYSLTAAPLLSLKGKVYRLGFRLGYGISILTYFIFVTGLHLHPFVLLLFTVILYIFYRKNDYLQAETAATFSRGVHHFDINTGRRIGIQERHQQKLQESLSKELYFLFMYTQFLLFFTIALISLISPYYWYIVFGIWITILEVGCIYFPVIEKIHTLLTHKH